MGKLPKEIEAILEDGYTLEYPEEISKDKYQKIYQYLFDLYKRKLREIGLEVGQKVKFVDNNENIKEGMEDKPVGAE